jgi:hypothetical protein
LLATLVPLCHGVCILFSLQHRLDAKGILEHSWFAAQLSDSVIARDMGERIIGYQAKYRKKLKASIYGSLFVSTLRSMSARTLSMR